MAGFKEFLSQNFNEEVKMLYAEESHKAVVNTLKETIQKHIFTAIESIFFNVPEVALLYALIMSLQNLGGTLIMEAPTTHHCLLVGSNALSMREPG